MIKKIRIPIRQIVLIGLLPSIFKKVYYKLKGYKIGKNVSFGLGSIVIGKEVVIGDNVKFGFLSVIISKRISIDRFVSIGSFSYMHLEELHIGEDSKIRESVHIAGIKTPNSILKIGERSSVMQGTKINPSDMVSIGDNTGIGGNCSLFTHGSWLPEADGYPVSLSPIEIGDNVWISWNVMILPGCTVGNYVVIGANSHINKDIPSNCIAIGNPIRIKVSKFPIASSQEHQERSFQDIIDDFRRHINYHGFANKVLSIINSQSFIIEFNRKGKSFFIYYLLEMDFQDLKSLKNNSLIILDRPFSEINDNISLMFIDLKKKTRIGSNIIGEEFLNFISRYGYRLKRLD